MLYREESNHESDPEAYVRCACVIVLHGSTNVYNESLQYVLSHELSTPCKLSCNINATAALCGGCEGDESILLFDASDGDHEIALQALDSRKRNGAPGPILAIYNLPRGVRIRAETLRRGVRGLFFSEDKLWVLLKGVRALLRGEVWLSHNTLLELALNDPLSSLARGAEASGLSQREIQVLAHASRGESNDEISELLCLSTHTIKTHLYNIYRKINVNNRFQASLWAAKHIE